MNTPKLVAKRLTFTEEALEMIENFKKAGSFRSLSSTVEEIVRRLQYIKEDGTVEGVNIQLKRLGIQIEPNTPIQQSKT